MKSKHYKNDDSGDYENGAGENYYGLTDSDFDFIRNSADIVYDGSDEQIEDENDQESLTLQA